MSATRQKLTFPIPRAKNSPNKAKKLAVEDLHARISVLSTSGLSLRAIAGEVGLHFTRVHQILKAMKGEGSQGE